MNDSTYKRWPHTPTKDEIKITRLRKQLKENFVKDLAIALELNSLYPLEDIIVEAAKRWLEDNE